MKLRTIAAIMAITALFAMACGQAPEKKETLEKPVQAETASEPAEATGEDLQAQEEPADETGEAMQEEGGTGEETKARDTSADAEKDRASAYGKIPRGYPVDACPVYKLETSEVLGGFHQTMEGIEMYHVVIGTQDDVPTVTNAIMELYSNNSQTFESMSTDLLVGEKDGWEYSIVINDGKEDGFAALVTYNLQKKQ